LRDLHQRRQRQTKQRTRTVASGPASITTSGARHLRTLPTLQLCGSRGAQAPEGARDAVGFTHDGRSCTSVSKQGTDSQRT
jgi:hypothetical protein